MTIETAETTKGAYIDGRFFPDEPRWHQISVGQVYVFDAIPPSPIKFGYLVVDILPIPEAVNAKISVRYFNQDYIETEPVILLANDLFGA